MDYAVHGAQRASTAELTLTFAFTFWELGIQPYIKGPAVVAAEAPNSACTVGVGGCRPVFVTWCRAVRTREPQLFLTCKGLPVLGSSKQEVHHKGQGQIGT